MAQAVDADRDDNLGTRRVVHDLHKLVASGHRFATIYADPPWAYRNESSHAAATNHYATLSLLLLGRAATGE